LKIASLAARVPSKTVSNEELIDLVRAANVQMDDAIVAASPMVNAGSM
jgi:hypothetical protein